MKKKHLYVPTFQQGAAKFHQLQTFTCQLLMARSNDERSLVLRKHFFKCASCVFELGFMLLFSAAYDNQLLCCCFLSWPAE